MNLRDRITRRRSQTGDRLIVDHDALSPVTHRPEPVGRGPSIEALLDRLEPIFDGDRPDDFAVVGPQGSGTTAIVRATVRALDEQLGSTSTPIGTTTRVRSERNPVRLRYVDTRQVRTPFAFYRNVLDVLSTDQVPESGVGTDDLRERVVARLGESDPGTGTNRFDEAGRFDESGQFEESDRSGDSVQFDDSVQSDDFDRFAVLVIDHVDEPAGLSTKTIEELLEPVEDAVTTIFVGRQQSTAWTGPVISVRAYRRPELIDVCMERATAGLAAGAVDRQSIDALVAWADGNAHDALAGLFGASILAAGEGASGIDDGHLSRAMADVPSEGVHLGRVLALSEPRQQVLASLCSLDTTDRPIRDLAPEIADQTGLAPGTVTRFCYELADVDILERVPLDGTGSGRKPSAIHHRFPSIPFKYLLSKTNKKSQH